MFNLNAQLNLLPPKNLADVRKQIQNSLGSVSVNLVIPANFSTNATKATASLNHYADAVQKASTSSKEARIAIDALSTAFNSLNKSVRGTNVAQFNTAMDAISKSTRTVKRDAEDFGRVLAITARRYVAFTVAAGAGYRLINSFQEGAKAAFEFQNEMVRVSQVTGRSGASLKNISSEITRLATTFGVSSKGLSEISTTLAQAGLTANDTKIALEALAKTTLAPTFGDIESTTEGAIAIMRQFKVEARDLEGVLGSINAVAAAYAVESQDVVDATKRAGAAFRAAGGSFNEFLALFTSVRETTRESAESIATGFRTIFTRLQRPQTIQFLDSLGIELLDTEGKFIGAYKAVGQLSTALSRLDTRNLQFAQIVEELGGYRQISRVIPLIQEYGKAQEALSIAQGGQASLTRDAIRSQESLIVQFRKVKEEFLSLIRTLSEDTVIKGFINTTLQLASSLITLTNALKPLLPLLSAFAVIKGVQLAGKITTGAQSFLGGTVTRRATGGLVPGYGNRDTEPALLTPGEYVLTKDEVKTIGISNIRKLKNLKGYNQGGLVGYSSGGLVQSRVRSTNLNLELLNSEGKNLTGPARAAKRAEIEAALVRTVANQIRVLTAEGSKIDANLKAATLVAKKFGPGVQLLVDQVDKGKIYLGEFNQNINKAGKNSKILEDRLKAVRPTGQNRLYDAKTFVRERIAGTAIKGFNGISNAGFTSSLLLSLGASGLANSDSFKEIVGKENAPGYGAALSGTAGGLALGTGITQVVSQFVQLNPVIRLATMGFTALVGGMSAFKEAINNVEIEKQTGRLDTVQKAYTDFLAKVAEDPTTEKEQRARLNVVLGQNDVDFKGLRKQLSTPTFVENFQDLFIGTNKSSIGLFRPSLKGIAQTFGGDVKSYQEARQERADLEVGGLQDKLRVTIIQDIQSLIKRSFENGTPITNRPQLQEALGPNSYQQALGVFRGDPTAIDRIQIETVKVEKTAREAADRLREFDKAMLALDDSTRAIIRGFERLSKEVTSFSTRTITDVDTQFGLANPGQAALARFGTASNAGDLNAELDRFQQFLPKTEFGAIKLNLGFLEDLQNKLPELQLQLERVSRLNFTDKNGEEIKAIRGTVDNFFTTALKDYDKSPVFQTLRRELGTRLEALSGTKSRDDFEKSQDDITKLPEEILKTQLTDPKEKLIKTFEGIVASISKLTDFLGRATDSQNQYNGILAQSDDLLVQRIKLQSQFNRTVADPAGINNILGQRINRLSGGRNIGDIQSTIISNRTESDRLKDSTQTADILRKNQLEVESNRLVEALKLIGDASTRTAATLEKLSEINEKRTRIQGLGQEFYGSDGEGRLKLLQDFTLSRNALKSGSLDGFTIEQQQRIVSLLPKLEGVGNVPLDATNNLIANTSGIGQLLAKALQPLDQQKLDLERQSLAVYDESIQATQALAAIQQDSTTRLEGAINRLIVSLDGYRNIEAGIKDSRPGFADGGVAFKPKGSDTLPAMLTPGEFIVNAKQSKKHRGLLHSINAGYFADGGVAGVESQLKDFHRAIGIDPRRLFSKLQIEQLMKSPGKVDYDSLAVALRSMGLTEGSLSHDLGRLLFKQLGGSKNKTLQALVEKFGNERGFLSRFFPIKPELSDAVIKSGRSAEANFADLVKVATHPDSGPKQLFVQQLRDAIGIVGTEYGLSGRTTFKGESLRGTAVAPPERPNFGPSRVLSDTTVLEDFEKVEGPSYKLNSRAYKQVQQQLGQFQKATGIDPTKLFSEIKLFDTLGDNGLSAGKVRYKDLTIALTQKGINRGTLSHELGHLLFAQLGGNKNPEAVRLAQEFAAKRDALSKTFQIRPSSALTDLGLNENQILRENFADFVKSITAIPKNATKNNRLYVDRGREALKVLAKDRGLIPGAVGEYTAEVAKKGLLQRLFGGAKTLGGLVSPRIPAVTGSAPQLGGLVEPTPIESALSSIGKVKTNNPRVGYPQNPRLGYTPDANPYLSGAERPIKVASFRPITYIDPVTGNIVAQKPQISGLLAAPPKPAGLLAAPQSPTINLPDTRTGRSPIYVDSKGVAQNTGNAIDDFYAALEEPKLPQTTRRPTLLARAKELGYYTGKAIGKGLYKSILPASIIADAALVGEVGTRTLTGKRGKVTNKKIGQDIALASTQAAGAASLFGLSTLGGLAGLSAFAVPVAIGVGGSAAGYGASRLLDANIQRQAGKITQAANDRQKQFEQGNTIVGGLLETLQKNPKYKFSDETVIKNASEYFTNPQLKTKEGYSGLKAAYPTFAKVLGEGAFLNKTPEELAERVRNHLLTSKDVKKFAGGGRVPGSGVGDKIPSLLEPDEFVIRKDAARAIGYGNLHNLNRMARGGKVGRGNVALRDVYDRLDFKDEFKYLPFNDLDNKEYDKNYYEQVVDGTETQLNKSRVYPTSRGLTYYGSAKDERERFFELKAEADKLKPPVPPTPSLPPLPEKRAPRVNLYQNLNDDGKQKAFQDKVLKEARERNAKIAASKNEPFMDAARKEQQAVQQDYLNQSQGLTKVRGYKAGRTGKTFKSPTNFSGQAKAQKRLELEALKPSFKLPTNALSGGLGPGLGGGLARPGETVAPTLPLYRPEVDRVIPPTLTGPGLDGPKFRLLGEKPPAARTRLLGDPAPPATVRNLDGSTPRGFINRTPQYQSNGTALRTQTNPNVNAASGTIQAPQFEQFNKRFEDAVAKLQEVTIKLEIGRVNVDITGLDSINQMHTELKKWVTTELGKEITKRLDELSGGGAS